MRVIVANHALVCDRAPIADAAVVVDESDRIVRVGAESELLRDGALASLPTVRVRGVVFPGLVNAHTHLELSALRGRVSGGRGFVDWVDRLVTLRPTIDDETASIAIEDAVSTLVATGTVAVGEVTNSLAAVAALARAGIAGCVFHEVFGWHRDTVVGRAAQLRRDHDALKASWPSAALAYAPAPHTLYTTHPEAVAALIAHAAELGAKTSLHLAEHASERRAVEGGQGPITDWIATRSRLDVAAIPWPRRPLFDHAASVGALGPNVVLVHLADARMDELDRVASSRAKVVLCPRSNLHIEARLPPLLAMRSAGIAPALGTDSLASCPSLDVLAEAASLRARFPDVPAWELVAMATLAGANALGCDDLGALREGARPGIFAVEGDVDAADPAAWLLGNLARPRVRLATTKGLAS